MFRECHKCPLNGKGSPECIECAGPAPVSYKGRDFVHIDTMDDPGAILNRDRRRPSEEPFEGETLEAYREGMSHGALRLLRWIMSLDPDEATIVLMALRGTWAEAGRLTGTTRACWSKRWRVLVRKMPELDAVVHECVRKAK